MTNPLVEKLRAFADEQYYAKYAGYDSTMREAADALVAMEAERDVCKDAAELTAGAYSELEAERDALQQRLDAAERYADHWPTCPIPQWRFTAHSTGLDIPACTCGFDSRHAAMKDYT